jgi:Cu/Zn superoxide dismutase
VIVHERADRGIPGPPKSGVSGGPRVACGVIQLDSTPRE